MNTPPREPCIMRTAINIEKNCGDFVLTVCSYEQPLFPHCIVVTYLRRTHVRLSTIKRAFRSSRLPFSHALTNNENLFKRAPLCARVRTNERGNGTLLFSLSWMCECGRTKKDPYFREEKRMGEGDNLDGNFRLSS